MQCFSRCWCWQTTASSRSPQTHQQLLQHCKVCQATCCNSGNMASRLGLTLSNRCALRRLHMRSIHCTSLSLDGASLQMCKQLLRAPLTLVFVCTVCKAEQSIAIMCSPLLDVAVMNVLHPQSQHLSANCTAFVTSCCQRLAMCCNQYSLASKQCCCPMASHVASLCISCGTASHKGQASA